MPKFIRPEFFDIFGIVTFAVIIFIAARSLFWGELVPYWALVFLLIIGILGIIIDGSIVYRTYLHPTENTSASEPPVIK